MPAKTADPGVTDDRLLGGQLVLRQPAAGFRVAIDSVLVAAACPAAPGERVLDLGCGVGAAALCLLRRVGDCRVTGLERDPGLAELARANAARNGLAERFEVVTGDLLAPPEALGRDFDHILTNPPYLEAGRHTLPADPVKRGADHEGEAGLAGWVGFARDRLRPGGVLTLIHRADQLDRVIARLADGFGTLELIPLWPHAGEPAKRIILRARRGRRSPARLLPGLVLHQADGRLTAEVDAILRGQTGFDFLDA